MSDPAVTWIDRLDQLPQVADRLAQAPWIALDTEANSMFVYRERVCLMQINAGGTCYLFDTLALADARHPGDGPSPVLDLLKPVLQDAERVKYLHGGEYDVGILKRDFAISLRGVWDSQQAASLLGWERTGYGAVVERVCAVVLDKAYTHYDWGNRPISDGALRYALDDVVYLPRVCDALRAEIAAADLDEELAIANGAVEGTGWSGGFEPAGFYKIKGVRDLGPVQTATLAALFVWRDGLARAANQPPGRLINNEALLALARSAPTSFQALKRTGLKGSFLAQHGEALIDLMRAARDAPPAVPPRPRHREVLPIEEEREKRMKDWRRGEAERRGSPLQVVLPAKALEYLKQHGADDLGAVPQLGVKRIGRYGDKLRELCRG